ncbi:hypothetical protein RB597_004565 [Gaeumannomyces tritici]
MPSFAPASPEGSLIASSDTMDDYSSLHTTSHHYHQHLSGGRARKQSRSMSPFLKTHGLHGGKESRIPQHHQQVQHQQSQEPDYYERKSTSSSLVSSISNGRASDAPPTTSTTKQRDLESGLPPPLTREEFEALPVAIQRKYFSTLERLQFAQSSSGVDGIFRHYCETSKRSRPRPDKGAVEPSAGRRGRLSLQTTTDSTVDTDLVTLTDTLPGRIQRHQLTREEQVALVRNLRASVILDAADEAISRVRRASTDYGTSICSPERLSMESLRCELPDTALHGGIRVVPSEDARPTGADSICDSFRWMDDDEDLDLRLFLNDYHANLRDTLPQPTKDNHPSFRRHMSTSKIQFGRSSVSSSRPGTKGASTPTSPLQSPIMAPINTTPAPHVRRRSRTLSLITAKHTAAESRETLPPIDPAAAHYQDPEARLKLRVYLASPQKFDEAIEFGFPSTDPRAPPPVPAKDTTSPPRSHSRQHSSRAPSRAATPGKLETFLADFDDDDNESDDKLSCSDQVSSADPESPKTPHSTTDRSMIRPMRPPRVPSPDDFGQAPGSSREMTLKMTLTRPDLRATEDQIYGWKQQGAYYMRKSQSTGGRDDMFPPTLPNEKDIMDRNPGGLDHWGPPQDQNVMKRIWNRVRRS